MDAGPVIASCAIFLLTYGLIFSERVHRTIAAMAGAVAMISAGIGLGFYDWETAVAAIDFNTIGLLLGMMIIVGILQKTGFFQYAAIVVAQWTRGNPWWLLLSLAGFTAVVSTILDNVTTIVMVAPVTMSIAEVVGVSAVPFLIAEAVCSNVGGVATLVGDPPNILIGSAANLSFNDFLSHLGPVVLVVLFLTFLLLKFLFRRELAIPPKHVDSLMAMEARRALLEAVSRVLSVAVIHEFLSHQESQVINIREVSQRIINQMRQGVLDSEKQIRLDLRGPNVYLPTRQATACAMIINELLQNAVEHGYERRSGGTVSVQLVDEGDGVTITIQDDGVGLPADFDREQAESLGLQIVRTLVEHDLRGQFELNGDDGVRAVVSFPKLIGGDEFWNEPE